MQYDAVYQGKFIARPNRFTAEVFLDGKVEICHVKNTGRCSELLVPGAEVYVQKTKNPARKTQFDLITVRKGDSLFNVDSTAPNVVFAEWARESNFFGEITYMKPECTFGASRFDFYLEAEGKRIFVEVKGVTLERDGIVLFPDAPTERGVKHVEHLIRCREEGFEAFVFFIAKTEKATLFMPNRAGHSAFADALLQAEKAGVFVHCLGCAVWPDKLEVRAFVPVQLL